MNFRQIGVALFTSCSMLFLTTSAIRLEDYFERELKVGEQLSEFGVLTDQSCHILPKESSKRFTLVHFWASYDATSRTKNIQWNEFFSQTVSDKIDYKAIALDPDKSVFQHTLAIDGLKGKDQLLVATSRREELIGRYALADGLHSYLIDDEGAICLVDPSLEELNHFYRL